jgi:hypothetical protein
LKTKPFLPSAAIIFFEELLHGNSEHPTGISNMLDNFDQSKADAPNILANPESSTVQKMQAEVLLDSTNFLNQTFNTLRERVKVIIRLRDDENMADVYSILVKQLDGIDQWNGFLSAALKAHYNYSRHRRISGKGKDLTREIASSALELAELIKEFQSLDLDNKPDELSRIRTLLALTDDSGLKTGMWQELRSLIIGNFNTDKKVHIEERITSPHPLYMLYAEDIDRSLRDFHSLESDFDDSQDQLLLAWNMAPDLPALLKTLAVSAKCFQPKQDGMVGKAISSQKPSAKMEYIRGCGYLLSQEYGIELSTQIKKAMVTVANIILQDPNGGLSCDDVRKALG